MFKKIFNRMLPPSEKIFFSYFEESAEICHQLAILLFRITHDGLSEEQLAFAIRLKRESNSITKKTLTRLNTAFITPIDRDDIQTISILLNKIARTVAKGISFLKTYQLPEFTENLKQQTAALLEACHELKATVLKFKKFKHTDAISDSRDKMGVIETRGDDIVFNAMSDIFSGRYNPLIVIKLHDVHKNVEKALDLCFLLSDTLVNVSLKHT